jgi:hypothetical protein
MVWQDRTADRLLRLLAINPDNIKHLELVIIGSLEETEGMESAEDFKASTGSPSTGTAKPEPRRFSTFLGVRPIRPLQPKDPSAPPATREWGAAARRIEIERKTPPDAPEPPSTPPPPT